MQTFSNCPAFLNIPFLIFELPALACRPAECIAMSYVWQAERLARPEATDSCDVT
jgi:hypothetical protein